MFFCRSFQPPLKATASTSSVGKSSGFEVTASNMFDLKKLKGLKDSCAYSVRNCSSFIKSSKDKSNQKYSYQNTIGSFVRVSTCVVPSSSSTIKRTSEPLKSVKLSSNSNNKDQTTTVKKLNKVKLDSKGRPIEGSSVNSFNPSKSVLMDRLTNSFKNIKIKQNSKGHSNKNLRNFKVDKNSKPLNKIGSFSSKQSKEPSKKFSGKSEWKRQQDIPMSRTPVNMFDSFATNFQSEMVSKNVKGKGCYKEIQPRINAASSRANMEAPSRVYNEVPESVYKNFPIKAYDQNSDRVYDEVPYGNYGTAPDISCNNADRIYEEIPDIVYEEVLDRIKHFKTSYYGRSRNPHDELPKVPCNELRNKDGDYSTYVKMRSLQN